MNVLLSLLLVLGLPLAASAQLAAPTATPPQCPPGPLLKSIPDNIQWTITSSEASEGEATAPTPSAADGKPGSNQPAAKTIVGQSVDDVRHIVTTYGNGNRMEVWKKSHARHSKNLPVNNSKMDVWEMDGSQYVMSTGWKAPVVSDAAPDNLYEDLGWISTRNFQTITKVNGVDCMVFRDTILPPGVRVPKVSAPLKDLPPGFTPPPTAAVDPEGLKVKAVALVEVERRLPVVVQLGDEITNFKFQSLDPQTPLTPPAEVDAAIAARVQQAQATTRRAVHP